VYIVASFYVYSQHENMLLVHQKMLRERLQAQPIVTAAAAAGEENGGGDESTKKGQ
jgi:hypothetical protein